MSSLYYGKEKDIHTTVRHFYLHKTLRYLLITKTYPTSTDRVLSQLQQCYYSTIQLNRMEEYDDLSQGPSNDGTLDLSHNTWKSLPPELNDYTRTLLHLDMKNNQLTNIDSIGNLILLRSLDVSFNQLSNIPESIGKCVRLRRLNVANNKITRIDEEIGNCILLVSSIVYYYYMHWSVELSSYHICYSINVYCH